MSEHIKIENMHCPNCLSDEYWHPYLASKGVYLCEREIEPGKFCKGLLFKCYTCNKIYFENGYKEVNGVCVCKTCGQVHEGLTSKKKTDRNFEALYQQIKLRNNL